MSNFRISQYVGARPKVRAIAKNYSVLTNFPSISRSPPTQFRRFRAMNWCQHRLTLPAMPCGFHLITREVVATVPEIANMRTGLLHVFIQHTSASLTINENADPDVPADLESSLSAIAPEDFPYQHTCEGPDDMPAHVKAALLGSSVSIPITDGKLCLGTWQGIYLCEHRKRGGRRRLVLTLWGENRQ
jgi:secondary thiamine-phosphate synthase enzyme